MLQRRSGLICFLSVILLLFATGKYAEGDDVSHAAKTSSEARRDTVQCVDGTCFVKIFSSEQALKKMIAVSEHLFVSYATMHDSQKVISSHGMEQLFSDIGLMSEVDEENGHEGHDHEGHNHHDGLDYWTDLMAEYFDEDGEDHNDTHARRKRSEDETEFPCFQSVEELLKAYFGLDESEEFQLTIGDFTALMPRILLYLKQTECRFEDDAHEHSDAHDHDEDHHGEDHEEEEEMAGTGHKDTNATDVALVMETSNKAELTVQCMHGTCFVKIFSSEQALRNLLAVTQYLFETYAIRNDSQEFISGHGTEQFIHDLGLMKEEHESHDHGDEEHDHEDEETDHDEHSHETHDHGDEEHDHEDEGTDHEEHGHSDEDHGDHGHDHGNEAHDHDHSDGDHDHSDENGDHKHAHEGHDHNLDADYWADIMADYFDETEHGGQNDTRTRKKRSEEEFPCFATVEEFVEAYFGSNASEDIHLSIGDFTALMPRTLLDAKRPECRFDDDPHNHGEEETASKTSIWLISLGSVFIISLVSLVGVLFIPLLRRSKVLNHLISLLVALAVGTLVGDALIHLLPHASHMHDSSKGTQPEGNSHVDQPDDHSDAIWKGFVACLGIYTFYVLETGMGLFRRWKSSAEKQDHEDPHDEESPSPFSASGIPMKPVGEAEGLPSQAKEPLLEDSSDHHKHGDKQQNDKGHSSTEEIDEEPLGTGHHHDRSRKVPKTIASLAWMIIVGDGLHNITDGLAIGAAFTASIGTGLGTVLAIFFHEIPQELGDFAVLLNSGMTAKQALFWNFISACTCFIGLFIGLLIGEYTTGIIVWILAFTAGGFLYIALVDMLPAVLKQLEGKHYVKRLVIQNIGLLSGFAIMLLIAFKEDSVTELF